MGYNSISTEMCIKYVNNNDIIKYSSKLNNVYNQKYNDNLII